jgi:hypothetical protein
MTRAATDFKARDRHGGNRDLSRAGAAPAAGNMTA